MACELHCDISILGLRPSANGLGGPDNLPQSSSGPSRNFERGLSQGPPVRLPPGPIPRANQPGQARTAPSQDTSSQASRLQSQTIPTSGGNPRLSDAYGGTTTSARVSSGPGPTTPSRGQSNRDGPIPGTLSSRPRGLPSGPSRPETSELPPSSWPQGLGYPEKSRSSDVSYHSSNRLASPAQDGPNVSGLPTTNGASGLLAPAFNRTSSGRDGGNLLRPPPLTLHTLVKTGFDPSPATATRSGIPRSFSPGLLGDSTTSKPDTSLNGATRRSDADSVPSKPPTTIPSPLPQRVPQLPELIKPSRPPQISQLLPPVQPLSPHPKASPLSPNGPPPSAFKLEEPGPLLSALPSGLPSGLRSALPSALVTSLPLRPADNPHSRNARISFFDPPNQALLDRLLATDSAIVASLGAGGGDNEEESVKATLTNVEEMLDGFEWATEDIFCKSSRGRPGLETGLAGTGSAEQIEARLLDELMALEKVGSYVEHLFYSVQSLFRRRTYTRSSSRTIG